MVAAEPEPEPVVAAEPEPEPEPVRGRRARAEPVAAEPEPAPEPERGDVIPQPAWPVAAPAAPAAPAAQPPTPTPAPEPAAAPWLTVAPDEGPAPQWPAAPQWGGNGSRSGAPMTLAGRAIVPQDNAAALWAASAREVLTGGQPTVAAEAATTATPQPCMNCGLSLSANARFCRRCGTRQG